MHGHEKLGKWANKPMIDTRPDEIEHRQDAAIGRATPSWARHGALLPVGAGTGNSVMAR